MGLQTPAPTPCPQKTLQLQVGGPRASAAADLDGDSNEFTSSRSGQCGYGRNSQSSSEWIRSQTASRRREKGARKKEKNKAAKEKAVAGAGVLPPGLGDTLGTLSSSCCESDYDGGYYDIEDMLG